MANLYRRFMAKVFAKFWYRYRPDKEKFIRIARLVGLRVYETDNTKPIQGRRATVYIYDDIEP